MSELGHTISSLRTKRGMSLQKVANAAGLTKSHVWELEQGKSRNPSVDTLVGLGSALGVSAMALFRAAMSGPPGQDETDDAAPGAPRATGGTTNNPPSPTQKERER